MAMFENVTVVSCNVRVTAGVAGAIVDRFVVRETTAPKPDEMITFVPVATGGYPDGILAMSPDIPAVKPGAAGFTGYVVSSYVPISQGCEAIIELGEACGQGVLLRAGGNGAEVDGAAYLADATGDIAIAKSTEAGVVGQKIRVQFGPYGIRP